MINTEWVVLKMYTETSATGSQTFQQTTANHSNAKPHETAVTSSQLVTHLQQNGQSEERL